jgi:hypothetical protein
VVGLYLVKYHLQYKELGANFFDRQNREYAIRRAVKRLNSLSYQVTLQPTPSETQQTAVPQ